MKKSNLRATAALQALALLGAGVPVAFFGAAPAAAQDYTRGVLVGTVTDEKGTPIAGAEVTVRSNEQGYQTTTVTDANGSFRAVALATGTYTVIVRRGGQTVVEDRGVSVVAGRTNTYGYTAGAPSLAGAAADQQPDTGGTIVVTGRRIQVDDFATTQTGANIDVAEIAQTVPVGRDQTSLILLAPGTTGGDAGFGNLASISGATVAENAYFVNGLNITDFRNFLGSSLIPFEFYRTLDVKTGGYQAEYGRALGGVTSAVTKSGSNEIQGGAVVSYTPDWLREQSPNTHLAINDTDTQTNVDGNFYLSGPLIRDRVFLYGLYSPRWFENSDTSISAQSRIRTTSDSPFWGVKADAVIFPGHRLEATIFSDKQRQRTSYTRFTPEEVGEDEDPQTGTLGGLRGNVINDFGGLNYIATYTGQFTDFLTLSASYGRNKDRNLQYADPPTEYQFSRLTGCDPVCDAAFATPYVVTGTVSQRLNDRNDRKIYRADADLYANFFGEHHFRAGFDYEKLRATEDTGYTGTGFYYDFRHNSTHRRLYFNQGGFNTNMRAYYLQDSWSMFDERLVLNLGIRNDRFRNYTQNGDLYYDSGNNWAPRIGATFDVFGDKRTKLSAFYGKYYLPIATNTNIRLGGAEYYIRQVMTTPGGTASDANGDGIPDFFTFDEFGNITNFVANSGSQVCPESPVQDLGGQQCASVYADGTLGPTDTLVAEGLKPSESTEMILGLSHRFGDGWSAGVDYVRRRLDETLEDVAVDAAVLAYCDAEGIEGCEDVFYGFHQYVLANPGSDITVRLDGDCDVDPRQCEVATLLAEDLGYPRAVRKYDAVQFTLDKAFNGFWSANFNYVYTKLRGNFEGGVKSDNNQTDTGLTQDFDQPGLVEGAYGDLANGRKHAFKLYGRVRPLQWLDVGVNAVLESPRKFSCYGNYGGPTGSAPDLYGSNYNFASEYGAASYWCQQALESATASFVSQGDNYVPEGETSYLVPRGTAFKSQWNRRIDLGLGFDLGALGEPLMGSQFRIDVFNLFNWKQKLDFDEFGDVNFAGKNPNYGRVTGYQGARSVRFSLAMRFGEGR